jgi:PhzF family phenazine biosynthesis protein
VKVVPIAQVDAFTSEPFRGNPAGVCLLHGEAPEEWMALVAAEMNLSETAFLVPGEGEFGIRYYTPLVEVPLCGHATLASAHLLWEQGIVPINREIAMQAKGGRLVAAREDEWIRLDFPTIPVRPAAVPEGLAEALGAEILAAYQAWEAGYLVLLDGQETVRLLQPDFGRLRSYGPIIATARATPDASVATVCFDFVSRFFAPSLGIDEDPVTGVAHCCLGPFWAERIGRMDLSGRQLSQRGGVVRVRVRGERVDLLGQAVTVMRGEMVGWSGGVPSDTDLVARGTSA